MLSVQAVCVYTPPSICILHRSTNRHRFSAGEQEVQMQVQSLSRLALTGLLAASAVAPSTSVQLTDGTWLTPPPPVRIADSSFPTPPPVRIADSSFPTPPPVRIADSSFPTPPPVRIADSSFPTPPPVRIADSS